jgi:hypothetical protein
MPHVPPFDPKQTWKEVWTAFLKTPPCPDPIWSPATDKALIEQTVAILERRNVLGVLSGSPERVRQWREAAPRRFIPALRFQIGGEPTPEGERTGICRSDHDRSVPSAGREEGHRHSGRSAQPVRWRWEAGGVASSLYTDTPCTQSNEIAFLDLTSNKAGETSKCFAERRLRILSPEISPSVVPNLYRSQYSVAAVENPALMLA